MNLQTEGNSVFEVIQEADGGFWAECPTETIVTQADTWEELWANVREAAAAYCYDRPKPKYIRLHFVRNEVLIMEEKALR